MQLLQSGVLTANDLGTPEPGLSPHCMPSSWTKATIAVRINQCVRGHSAISRNTIHALLRLVAARVTPVVPLRGSISASGDLMPLAYVAGSLEGSPDIYVTIQGGHTNGTYKRAARIMSARDALAELGMEPLQLGPREGLGLVNGTAASAAAASLVVYDAMQLCLISAGLTCLVAEGMAARTEWLHPFIGETRPHPGQQEMAGIMRAFLKGSLLVSDGTTSTANGNSYCHHHDHHGRVSWSVRPDGGLAQDRYPLRTSPQWLGPLAEDLLLAHAQITVELNSTSDNPLADPASGTIHHGGNFQAVSVTSAVEKIRSGLQMVGKLLFAQCTELLNHNMTAGLPPNLAADDPSVSFCCKGLDISMAAYQSELSYLANSMSNHVQSAEMHNQAVNSLALLATRYTMQAVELLGLMVSGVLYAACQAMDLTVMHATFLEAVATMLPVFFARLLPSPTNGCMRENGGQASSPPAAAVRALQNAWWANSASDAADRCASAASAFIRAITDCDSLPSVDLDQINPSLTRKEIRQQQGDLHAAMLNTYKAHSSAFMKAPTTETYVGSGSRCLYLWVRKDLGIPMHCGLKDHPTSESSDENGSTTGEKRTIGSHLSTIYEMVRNGKLFERFAMASKAVGLDDGGRA